MVAEGKGLRVVESFALVKTVEGIAVVAISRETSTGTDAGCNSCSGCEKRELTDRFYVAMRLFSNRSQMTSKCGKNKEVTHERQASVSLMFLPHFDVLCNVLLNRPTAAWNLYVNYYAELLC